LPIITCYKPFYNILTANRGALQNTTTYYEYRRYKDICFKYNSEHILPSYTIDCIWKYELLDTKKYYENCIQQYGKMIDYTPFYCYTPAEIRAKQLYTLRCYVNMYGELPPPGIWGEESCYTLIEDIIAYPEEIHKPKIIIDCYAIYFLCKNATQ